jgi:hypothetical protein
VTATPISYTVFLLNALGDNETLEAFKEQFAQDAPEFRVVGEAVAKQIYKTSFIVDIAGDKEGDADNFAKRLEMALSAYPDGEDSFSADFLIVVGLDRT